MSNKKMLANYITHKTGKNKKLKLLILTLMTLFLMVMIPLGVLPKLVFNEKTYHSLYEKNGVTTTFDNATLNEQTKAVIKHLEGKAELSPGFFTTDEITHLTDVKVLLNRLFITYYVLLALLFLSIILLFFYGDYELLNDMAYVFLFAGLGFILISMILGIISFTGLFESFHRVFFPQGNYAFPQDSNLIRLFPEGFFQDMFKQLITYSQLQSILYAVIGGIFLWRKKKNKKTA